MKPQRHRQTGPCPTPQKPAYETEKERLYWARRRINDAIAHGHISPPLYGYLCSCGGLHLTKRPSWDGVPLVLVYEVAESLQQWAIGQER